MSEEGFLLIYSGIIIANSSLAWVYFQSSKIFFERPRATIFYVFFSALFIFPVLQADAIILFVGLSHYLKQSLPMFFFILAPSISFTTFIMGTFIYFISTSKIENT